MNPVIPDAVIQPTAENMTLGQLAAQLQQQAAAQNPGGHMQAFISDGETQTALQQTLAKMLSFQRSAPPTVGERALVGLAAALGVQFGAPGAALASAAAEIIHGFVASSLPKPDPVRRRRRR